MKRWTVHFNIIWNRRGFAGIFVKLQKQGVNGLKMLLVNKYKYVLSARLCIIGFFIPCIVSGVC